MPVATRAAAATPGAQALSREVARVRRRARAVLIAGAAVAALAADAWYEIISFWLFRLLRLRVWFPLFFLVALAVFAAAVVRRTRTLPLSARLDERFGLKARLASAYRFGRLETVPAELREAQAREALRAVDFARLRGAFRFRPWGALALLAAGVGLVAWHVQRYPASFNPHSVAIRQGRVVFQAVKSLGAGSARQEEGAPGEAPPQGDDSHPQVALVPEQGMPKQEELKGAPASGATGEKPPAAGEKATPGGTGPADKPAGHPDGAPKPRSEGKVAKLGGDEGGSFGTQASLEETAAVSAPTARPGAGLAAAAADLRGPGTGRALPPVPFLRLLGGGGQELLFDPETLNIVLEAYPQKYREHLESYLKALQTLREARNGS